MGGGLWGGAHTQCTDDGLWVCVPETHIHLLTSVTQKNLIKRKKKRKCCPIMLPPLPHLSCLLSPRLHVCTNKHTLTPQGPRRPRPTAPLVPAVSAEALSHAPFPNHTPLASAGLHLPASPLPLGTPSMVSLGPFPHLDLLVPEGYADCFFCLACLPLFPLGKILLPFTTLFF